MDARLGYSALIVHSRGTQSVSSAIPLTFVDSGQAARSIIRDPKKRFAAVFIDPLVNSPGGIHLIADVHRYRPATPVFALYDKAEPFSRQEIARLALHGMVPQPLSHVAIRERIGEEIFQYTFEDAPTPAALSAEDQEYLPVRASDFLVPTPSIYDVHVRLPSGRYFKILAARDSFTPERVLSYIEKGLTHFYLRKASVGRCTTYCDALARFLLTHGHISWEMKACEVMNQGQEVVEAIRQKGLDENHIDYAESFIASIRLLIRQLKLENRAQIQALLSNFASYDHGVSVAMVASLLALPLKIETESAFRAIGLAALLHDIGLLGMSEAVQAEDEARMTPHEMAAYLGHPLKGAEILSQFPEIDEVAVQAVAQHHERRSNKGFPGRVSSSEINRVAELIGISDELVKLLHHARKNPSLDWATEMEKNFFNDFSFPVIESFRTVFLEKSSRRR